MNEVEKMLRHWRKYVNLKEIISKFAPELDPDDPILFKVTKRRR